MAETAVSLVIEQLIPLLTKEAELLSGVHREVTDIKDELESIRSLLKDADARLEKGDVSEGIKTWVKQVREESYHIKDVIDGYMLHVAPRRDQHGFKGFLHKLARLVKKLKRRHDIASEIQDIKRSVREIKERSLRYAFSPSKQGGSGSDANTNTWHDPRVASLFIEEAELVGIESPKAELVSKLVGGASTRTVVSVVGMGGIGKTTLAKKVYDDQAVKARFDCHAWITVSQSYNIEELLRSIIRKFRQSMMKAIGRSRMEATTPEIDTMDKMLLINELREYLQRKRYVVAFDDVWEVEFWGDIEYALFDNNNGSRIIITTRIKDVANFCKKSAHLHVHELQPLPPKMAWELFCRKAFFDRDGRCPLELEELSFNIIERCGGLPLAIVTIGSLMSTKGNDVTEWQNMHNSLSSELESNPHLTSIKRILTFSYHDLPYHLKTYFLYFGVFPEDYSINCSRLIRLWIANGFVKERQGVTLEEVAKKHLTELIHRSLVQVENVSSNGEVKSCRVHDLIREVILSRSEELSFNQMTAENYSTFNGIARHLSICNRENSIPERVSKFQTRSIILFEVEQLPNSLIKQFFANFKFVNVLDFEGAPLNFIPEELGNLLYLSYLSIKSTNVKALPKSIGKLHNLETLDLRQSLVDELLVKANGFPKLQYLLAFYVHPDTEISFEPDTEISFEYWCGIKIQGSIGCLKAIQKLNYFDIQNSSINSISELGKLKQLRKLGITNLKRENGMSLCKALEKMIHLESLWVTSTGKEEFIELQSISSPPPFLLQRLGLRGPLEKLPDWIPELKSLTRVYLFWSRLTDDPLRILEALPNLLDVELHEAYIGEQLHFKEGGFHKLKRLSLGRLNGLNKLIIDQGALVFLEELEIGPIPQLKEVPAGIKHLINLETLDFIDMPRELVVSVLPDQGPDYSKVEHIPYVLFSYRTQGEQYKTYDLQDSSDLLEFLQI